MSAVKEFYEKMPFPREKDEIEYIGDLEKHQWIFNSIPEEFKALTGTLPMHPNMNSKEKIKILDAGCGTGEMSFYLSQFGDVTGVDFSEASVEEANELKKKVRSNNLNFKVEDLTNLKLKDKFNYIFCMGVLHHIPNIEKAFRELKKVMDKDSLMVICVYNMYGTFTNKLKYRIFPDKISFTRWKDFIEHPYMKTYSKKGFKKILEKNGFEVVGFWNNIPGIIRLITGKGMMMTFCVKKK